MDWADISRYARNITLKSLQIVKFGENYAQRVEILPNFKILQKFIKNSSNIRLEKNKRFPAVL